MKPILLEKAKGAFYGAVLGDVIGVPYKSKTPEELRGLTPDIIGTGLKNKTYSGEPFGVWSDDTSLMLCVATAYLNRQNFVQAFVHNMIDWYDNAAFTSTNRVFDIEAQTANSIIELKSRAVFSSTPDAPAKGNGALMRTLPCAFAPTLETAIAYAIVHGRATHNNEYSECCTVFYTLTLWHVIRGVTIADAVQQAYENLASTTYKDTGVLDEIVIYCRDDRNFKGTGYVLDSLGTSVYCAAAAGGTIHAIRNAILYGNDTDTTAALAGGIAGGVHGFTSDLNALRSKVVNVGIIDSMWEMLEKEISEQNKSYTM